MEPTALATPRLIVIKVHKIIKRIWIAQGTQNLKRMHTRLERERRRNRDMTSKENHQEAQIIVPA